MRDIGVLIWGFGAMGQGMASMLSTKRGVKVKAVCDIHPDLVGKKVSDICVDVIDCETVVSKDIDTLLKIEGIDIALLCTDSFTKAAYPKIEKVVKHNIHCISTAEEMAYPKAQEPKLAEEMDTLAKKHGVCILGTGINPGFIMDLLVVALSGAMADVNHISVTRVNSLSPFGPAVMHEQGVGITKEDFENRSKDHTLAGHVGFIESMHMMADALGVPLSKCEQKMLPIMTDVDRKSPFGEAKKGTLAGIDMTGKGFVNNQVFIDMKHPQQIEPNQVGIHTKDEIRLKGTPDIHMTITPEIDGGIGTIAMCVNMIPHVLNAKPGLKTMIDLPVPRAILGDMRDLLDR